MNPRTAPQDRTPRDTATRQDEVRTTRQWLPPSLLPEPAPEPGYVHRWIRFALNGAQDPAYISKSAREGWEPCKLSEHPELRMQVNPRADGVHADMIEMGGLVLCRMPKEMAQQRDAYYARIATAQNQRASADYAQINDPRMPQLKPKIETEVEFGRGRASTTE